MINEYVKNFREDIIDLEKDLTHLRFLRTHSFKEECISVVLTVISKNRSQNDPLIKFLKSKINK